MVFTVEEIRDIVPKNLKSSINDSVIATLNSITEDEDICRSIKENFIGFSTILKEGRFKLQDYTNAVTFVSFVRMGNNYKEAYAKTFPNRFKRLIDEGKSTKDISGYVSMYTSNVLVKTILDQSIIPLYIYNQDLAQKAINVLAEEMLTAPSAKVRVEAANNLLNHVKKPETKQIDLQIGIAENSGLKELREDFARLAAMQIEHINNGRTTKDVLDNSMIIVEEVKDEEDC